MAARHGRDKVTLVFPEPIQAFGAWTEQLLAESTGKEGRGLVPVHGEALACRMDTATTASSYPCI